jgi:hypothetical protein
VGEAAEAKDPRPEAPCSLPPPEMMCPIEPNDPREREPHTTRSRANPAQIPRWLTPIRGSFEAPSRGSFEAPIRGSFEAVSGSNAPIWGSFEAVSGSNAPIRGSFEAVSGSNAPIWGSFEAASNGTRISAKKVQPNPALIPR